MKIETYQRVMFKDMHNVVISGVVTDKSNDNNLYYITGSDGGNYIVPLKNVVEIL